MSQFKTTFQGFDIVYGENSDVWECYSLRLEAATLSKLKEKIGKHVRDAIKTADLVYGVIDWSTVKKVQIVGRDNATGQLWVVGDDGRRSREKPEKLVEWSSDIEEKLAEAARLDAEANAILRQADTIKKTIKPMTTESIDELIATISKRIVADAE